MKINILLIIFFLAAVNTLHAQLSFESNGQRLNYSVGQYVTLGDYNRDGTIDAFVSNGDNYRVYFGDGHGLFTAGSQVLNDVVFGKPAAGDINADGILEVIKSNVVWLNDGHGRFTVNSSLIPKPDTLELSQPKLADLNGDGSLDLAFIANNTAMRVFYNDGNGHFTDSGQKLLDGILQGSILANIAIGDVNGDDNTDIVSTGWIMNGSTVCPNRVWFGDSMGNFRDSDQLLDEGESHVHYVELGDLNNDGKVDIVMLFGDTTRAGRIWWNDGTGHFTAGANIPGSGGESVAISDFDGNGTQDMFVAQILSPNQVWQNDGTGQFRDSINLGSHCYLGVAAGDFNADEKMDAFTVGCVWPVNSNNITPAYAQVWLNTTPVTSVETKYDAAPARFYLKQNYPNPFNPSTTISYLLPALSNVKLTIYNILGQKIRTLINSFQNAGEHSIVWNGMDDSNNPVSSGFYFYSLSTSNINLQKKMILMR